MKLRKYILQYKIQQIDTQYPYICVFHCSRGFSATQWRRLKNVLYQSQGNTFILGSTKGRLREQPIRSFRNNERVELIAISPTICLDARYPNKLSDCEAQGSGTKHPLVHEGANPAALVSKVHPQSSQQDAVCPSAPYPFSGCTPSEQTLDLTLAHRPQTDETKDSQFHTKLTNIAGPFCIVYSSVKIQDAADLNNSWLKLFKKIGHCEQNDNFILLYAQLKSTTVNHIDMKHAMNLERTSVLELFMRSMHSPGQYLDLCLNEGPLYLHLYL